jgi:hypothetical protein
MGDVPPQYIFPEGSISFNAGSFNAIKLTSTATDFAIGNVNVATVPEPASLGLFLGAVAWALLCGACTPHSRQKAAFYREFRWWHCQIAVQRMLYRPMRESAA